MGAYDNPIYDYYAQRFGSPVNPDEHPSYLSDEEHRQNYGSNTRYNQLQNYPYNTTVPTAAIGGGYDTEDYIESLMDGRPNNIMDLDALRALSQNGMSLNDVLTNMFGSVTRRNQLQNSPHNSPDYEGVQMPSREEYQPNNIDDTLYYMTEGNPPPTSPKTTRPILMTYDQYKQDYMPLWDLYDRYTEYVEPIRNSDWRDNDPTYRYLKEVKDKDEFDSQMRKRQ